MNKISPSCLDNSVGTERLTYIDRAKGLAILLVVFGHVFCHMGYPSDEAMMHLKSYQFIAIFHMPLFFFLSGLVTRSTFAKVKDIARDLWRRFRMILVPAIVVGSLMTLFKGHTILDFFEAHMKFGYWYLFVLFEMYLMNYIFSFFCNKVKHGGLIGELVIGVLFYGVLSFVYRHLPENVWQSSHSIN